MRSSRAPRVSLSCPPRVNRVSLASALRVIRVHFAWDTRLRYFLPLARTAYMSLHFPGFFEATKNQLPWRGQYSDAHPWRNINHENVSVSLLF